MVNEAKKEKLDLSSVPFKELYEAYDMAFCKLYNDYIALQKEMDKFRGKVIDQEIADAVNPVLVKIQDTFHDLNPAVNNIIQRYQACARLMQDYQEFVEHLKQGGCISEDEAQA